MIDVASASEAPVSTEKRRRGRPKKQPETPILDRETVPEPGFEEAEEPKPSPEAETAAPSEFAAPYPPIQPITNFENFTNYWNNVLTPAQRRQGTVYLYRLQPKVLLVQGRGGRMVNANCEKFNEEDGPVTKELIRARRRMGVYLLRLSQRVTKPTGEICKCEVEIQGDLTDPIDMPILDVGNLDLDYEGNRDYIRVLKSRGILKASDGPGGEDMAASEVLGNLAGRAIDVLSERNQTQPAAAVQSTNDGVGKELVGLLREQIQQNRPPEQQGTVGDHVKSLVDLAKSMTPPAMDLGPYVELQRENNKLVQEMMQKDVARAEADARAAREQAEAFKASIPKPLTLREQLAELDEWDRMRKKLRGKDDEEGEEKAGPPAMGFWGAIPSIVREGLVPVLREANVMLYNFRLNGGALPLNPATGKPSTEPLNPDDAEEETAAANMTPEQKAHMEHMQRVVNVLTKLEEPMMKRFLAGKPGSEFARFVIDEYGPESFGLVVSVGRNGIIQMLQQYPPVWNQVGQRLAEFTRFLDAFMTYAPAAIQ